MYSTRPFWPIERMLCSGIVADVLSAGYSVSRSVYVDGGDTEVDSITDNEVLELIKEVVNDELLRLGFARCG
jgi:hypothetical protein